MISQSRAVNFLLDLVNLDARDVKRMHSTYADVLGDRQGLALLMLRDDMRAVWDAKDLRHRDWYLFRLRDSFHGIGIMEATLKTAGVAHLGELDNQQRMEMQARLNRPPEITLSEAVLFYLQTIGDHLRHCPNATCALPYFIADKKWQKYCSEACAAPAVRESKRKWWADNRAKNGGIE